MSKFTSLLLTLGISVFSSVGAANAAGFERAATNPTGFHSIIDQFQQFANEEAQSIDLAELGARSLDPSRLQLAYTQDVNVYFINEGAYYRNQLGVVSTGTTQFEQMIFSDITCTSSDCLYKGYRDPQEQFGTPDNVPLQIGDYYQLGNIEAGSRLDFYLRQDGYNRKYAQTFYTDTERNFDGLQHLLAYDYQSYLVLAWEDLTGGGDLDYNDVVFVVDIGQANLESIPTAAAPEPQGWMAVILVLILGWKFNQVKIRMKS